MTVREMVLAPFPELKDMFCYDCLKNVDRFDKSVGTLGGGNHFIEVNVSSDGSKKYLVIHTGSRNVGKQVADYYQNIAIEKMCGKVKLDEVISAKISELKSAGKSSEIQSEVAKIKSQFYSIVPEIPKELSYLTGEDREKYLHDMKICQRFAVKNRETIACVICEKMGWNILNKFHTIHNYIEEETNMVRKGAISAKLGEKLIIPINMRDGSILGEGLGNEDWNYSAPHGAGRLMGRMNAKRTLSLDEYRNQMSDVYTTSVSFDTLDEAPLAYKSMDEILEGIKPTVKVLDIIKPVYNFKASE
jgi:tRNA-splicing ligase RtcB (3'-phosphate/5'-hydroxy nucleic acid ligase)